VSRATARARKALARARARRAVARERQAGALDRHLLERQAEAAGAVVEYDGTAGDWTWRVNTHNELDKGRAATWEAAVHAALQAHTRMTS
jgi:uncharacterized protein YmfQ (DUF2313 family)